MHTVGVITCWLNSLISRTVDGYASIAAETIVVGASAENPVTGRKADAVQAAWYAAEASIRQMKVGEKNWTVSETVNKATKPFETAAVEG